MSSPPDKPYAYAAPWACMQFFDDNGTPLHNGMVYTYIANGFAKLPTYPDINGPNEPYIVDNPAPLTYSGHLVVGDRSMCIAKGYNYNFVACASDGETVTQSVNNIYLTSYKSGENTTAVQELFSHNAVKITSTFTDPFLDQGDTYLWSFTSNTPLIFDGTHNINYTVSNLVPRGSNEIVGFNADSVAFDFNYNGAYRIDTIINIDANGYWPADTTIFGRVLKRLRNTDPLNKSYNDRYVLAGSEIVGDEWQQQTFTDSFIVSSFASDQLQLSYYAYNPSNPTAIANVTGTIMITRIGEQFTQEFDKPIANFTWTPTTADAPVVISFTSTSTNNPTDYYWDFGDGGVSTSENPQHTYNFAGTYTVSLIASNANGSSDPVYADITLTGAPPVGIVLIPFDVVNTASCTVNTLDVPFSAADGQRIVICTQGLAGTYTNDDTYIRLFFNGSELDHNDQAQEPFDVPNGDASYLSWNVSNTGTYTFKIGAWLNTRAQGVAGYQVS